LRRGLAGLFAFLPNALIVCTTFALGCGGAGPPAGAPNRSPPAAEAAARQDKAAGGKEAKAADAPAEPRKIIFTAQMELTVEDFDKASDQLKTIVKEHNAYVARSEVRGAPGSPRDGSWTVRVPAAGFDAFLAALGRLGELRRTSVDSDDITEKYYDLKAHLKTNQVEEEGLQKLYLEKAPGSKLDELAVLRRELAAVRGTIESQQGQVQRWDKETQFSTVTVHLVTRSEYTPASAPTFGVSIARTFHGSVDNLAAFGKGLFLLLTAVTPWFVILALVGVPTWYIVQRQRRRTTPSPVAPASSSPLPSAESPT
jgi:hypothetical protein